MYFSHPWFIYGNTYYSNQGRCIGLHVLMFVYSCICCYVPVTFLARVCACVGKCLLASMRKELCVYISRHKHTCTPIFHRHFIRATPTTKISDPFPKNRCNLSVIFADNPALPKTWQNTRQPFGNRKRPVMICK